LLGAAPVPAVLPELVPDAVPLLAVPVVPAPFLPDIALFIWILPLLSLQWVAAETLAEPDALGVVDD
jgi:hypothetical protein